MLRVFLLFFGKCLSFFGKTVEWFYFGFLGWFSRRVAAVTCGDVFCRRVALLVIELGAGNDRDLERAICMIQGTTPTVSLRCDIDLTGWRVQVTLKAGETRLVFEDVRVEPQSFGCIVAFELTQEETLQLDCGTVKAQVRAEKDGKAVASTIAYTHIGKVLTREVL